MLNQNLNFYCLFWLLHYSYFLTQEAFRKNKIKPKGGNRRPTVIPAEASTDVRHALPAYADCHSGLYQLEDFREEENVLIGEGPNPNLPLSSLEKLHIIAGYALSRKDIRHDQKQLLDILHYSHILGG